MSLDEQIKQRLDAARLNSIPIKELSEADRPKLLAHLLALGKEDRYLRFGGPLGDAVIEHYVAGINLERDRVFGVFDHRLDVVAAGHFAHMPDATGSDASSRSAEFGLSVAENGRGKGIGTALFVRAATHARNAGIDILFMHCLSQNKAMMHIARKAGMKISLAYGEADAFISLEPADAASRIAEAMHAQIALFDYAVKAQIHGVESLWPAFLAPESA